MYIGLGCRYVGEMLVTVMVVMVMVMMMVMMMDPVCLGNPSPFRTHLVRNQAALGCRTKGIHQWYVSIKIWFISYYRFNWYYFQAGWFFILKVERGGLHHKLALRRHDWTQDSGLRWGSAFSTYFLAVNLFIPFCQKESIQIKDFL